KQVRGGRVTDRVGAHPLLRQGGQLRGDGGGISFDQRVNAEPREGLAAPVEEDVLAFRTILDEGEQLLDRPGPQRTAPLLVTLAVNQYGRGVTARRLSQVQVGDAHVRNFVGPGAGVVQEQQHGVIATALSRRYIWGSQQG